MTNFIVVDYQMGLVQRVMKYFVLLGFRRSRHTGHRSVLRGHGDLLALLPPARYDERPRLYGEADISKKVDARLRNEGLKWLRP